MDQPVTMTVPLPLYNIDAELSLMTALEFVMRTESNGLTAEETARVVEWFSKRYSQVVV